MTVKTAEDTTGGLEGPKLPTLLESRGSTELDGDTYKDKLKLGTEPSRESTAIPVAQVFGAASFSDDEDACDTDGGDPIPPNRKAAEEMQEDEEFWTKAQEALEDRSRRERLLKFMKRHRFKDVNSSSGWFFNFRFPLHAAVEDNDAEMIRILLHFKAKTKLKDASGWSARQLARKRNVNGSHDAVLQLLNDHAMARRKRAAARRAAKENKVLDGEGKDDAKDAVPEVVPASEERDEPSPEGI
eukprot:Skav203164  [mRNA]  locus=scaffold371:187904:207228:+ [translate_table: standard]